MDNDSRKSKGASKAFAWGFLIVALVVLAICVFFLRNPFMPKSIDARAEDAGLEENFKGSNPYVTIENVDLEFTGFYSIDDDSEIATYCFMGTVGGRSTFFELSAETVNELTDDVTGGIKGCTVTGKLIEDSEVIGVAAQDESMEAEDYRSYYNIDRYTVDEAHNDMEVFRIIYGIAFLAIIAVTILIAIFSGHHNDYEEIK